MCTDANGRYVQYASVVDEEFPIKDVRFLSIDSKSVRPSRFKADSTKIHGNMNERMAPALAGRERKI